MGKVEKRRMDLGKHKEVKLVHEVKMEVDSRDEARHTEERSVTLREEVGDGRASVIMMYYDLCLVIRSEA